jgi:hypothetical protein
MPSWVDSGTTAQENVQPSLPVRPLAQDEISENFQDGHIITGGTGGRPPVLITRRSNPSTTGAFARRRPPMPRLHSPDRRRPTRRPDAATAPPSQARRHCGQARQRRVSSQTVCAWAVKRRRREAAKEQPRTEDGCKPVRKSDHVSRDTTPGESSPTWTHTEAAQETATAATQRRRKVQAGTPTPERKPKTSPDFLRNFMLRLAIRLEKKKRN